MLVALDPCEAGFADFEASARLAAGLDAELVGLFVEDGLLSDLNFDIGVVVNGEPLLLSTRTYSSSTSAFFYNSDLDPDNRMLVLEMRIPEILVQQMGNLDLFARVSDVGPQSDLQIGGQRMDNHVSYCDRLGPRSGIRVLQ